MDCLFPYGLLIRFDPEGDGVLTAQSLLRSYRSETDEMNLPAGWSVLTRIVARAEVPR